MVYNQVKFVMYKHSVNFYFLRKVLHPRPYPGYRQSIINLLVNKNAGENFDKFLFIKEITNLWFFPKGHLIGENLFSSFFESISQNFEKELGLRGIKIFDVKPSFTQLAYIFDFDRQKYNPSRRNYEASLGNPTKGKIYHLVIMECRGLDKIPVEKSSKVQDYKWVSKKEGLRLLESCTPYLESSKGFTEDSPMFYKRFFEKIIITFEGLEKLRTNTGSLQTRLI